MREPPVARSLLTLTAPQTQALQSLKDSGEGAAADDGAASASGNGAESNGAAAAGNGAADGAAQWRPTADCPKPVAASVRRKLQAELHPALLEVADDSARHAGHAGARGTTSPSGETHFKARRRVGGRGGQGWAQECE